MCMYLYMCSGVSSFNGISTFVGYIMPNPGLKLYYLIHSLEDKGVHNFAKSICPKVNVIAEIQFELAYPNPKSIVLTITSRGHA